MTLMTPTRLVIGALVASCIGASAAVFITNPANGNNYALTDRPGTWHQAEAQAVSYGGNLVAVNDAAENAWLVSTFGTDLYWIGFTDEASEGTWAWSNGDPVTYTNWLPGEPNNAQDEDWAHINWAGNAGGWNDWEAGAGYTDKFEVFHAQNDSYPTLGIMEVPSASVPDGGYTLGMLLVAAAVLLRSHRRLA